MTDEINHIHPLTFDEAEKLKPGIIIYELGEYNYDGTAKRWKVNGMVKRWVTMPWRIQVPLKRGMYYHSYVTEFNLDRFALEEPPKIGRARQGKPL